MPFSPRFLLASVALAGSGPVLAGCSAADGGSPAAQPAPTSTERSDAVERVETNLARLRALDVFEVGALIVRYPEEAYACYGGCTEVMDEVRSSAALELARFTDLAEQAAREPMTDACAPAVIDANLAALRALDVVEVGELIVEQPGGDRSCYGVPCPEEVAAADAVTCARANQLASMAERSAGGE